MTTSIARHASKKASAEVSLNYKLCSFSHFPESEFDQTTNYSVLYAEENSVVEFDYLLACSEQENTVTTYYTEGTPFETPPHFSTSTSTTDLLRLEATDAKGKLEKSKSKPGSYMDLENKDKECESTDAEIYLPEDSDDYDYDYNEEDDDDKCSNEDRLEERIINVTPSQSPVEPCDKDKEGKMASCTEQTPLVFSRCSSLGSLSGYEQQSSIQDDHSSVVSDFSRRTSEVVSPSELPDSPAQFAHKRLAKKKLQPARDKPQSSVFEDDLAVFKEESTPVKFHSVAASSLSSLTIDDEDEGDEHGESKGKAALIRTAKTGANREEDEKKPADGVEENACFSVDEEKILDEYIRKGIAKVTRRHINDVSSLNSQANSSYDSDQERSRDVASEAQDDSCDLTAEEERLLDECIRRGIAKVTRQNIDDVSSLGSRTKFAKHKTRLSCEKAGARDEDQEKREEAQKRTE